MKKIFFFITPFFLFLILFPINIHAQLQTAALSLEPASGSYSLGSNFTLNIRLNTNGNNTDGTDIKYLNYNPALLEVQDSNLTSPGAQIQPGSLYTNTNLNSVDVSNGRINFSQTSSGGVVYNGSGILASITFKPLTTGAANLTFNFTLGSTIDTNVACLGQDVLNSVVNGSYTLTQAADTTAPQISNITSTNIGQTSATITWTTDENSTSRVEYGTTVSYGYLTILDSNLVASHSVALSNLQAGAIYHYRVISKDVSNNEKISGDNFFTTISADNQAPQISGRAVSEITQTTVKITWITDEDSSSKVEYGATANYGSTANTSGLTKTHSVSLSGLSAGVTYHYAVSSEDSSSNEATSGDATFTTTSPTTPYIPPSPDGGGGGGGGGGGSPTPSDSTAPMISEILATNTTQNSITISWRTNENAISQVEYGLTSTYGNVSPLTESYLASHSVIISGLNSGVTYYYRLVSKDQAGNKGTSSTANFTTATAAGEGGSSANHVSTIKGKITNDSLTGNSLAGAQIVLSPGNYKTTSLSDGAYQLDNILIGTYSLTVSKGSYFSYTAAKVTVSEEKINNVNIYLRKQSTGGEEISTPEASLMPNSSVGKTIPGTSFMAYAPHLRGGYFISSGKVLGDGKTKIVTGTGQGFGPQVSVFDEAGNPLVRFFAYQKHLRGGIRVAVGDLEGDGVDEIITGSGPGGTPHIQIFNGKGERLTPGFWALDGKFKGGVFVAGGDINGDGKDEIIVTAGKGGGAQVMAYDKDGKVLLNFFAYDQYTFRGGISVSKADLNGDGVDEIVTVPEVGTTHIQTFTGDGKKINPGFYAFNQNFKGGGSVAGGDINGDGKDEFVVGVGINGGSQIRILNEKGESLKDDFTAYEKDFIGGVNVGAGDLDGDGKFEILILPCSDGSPDLKIIKL
ncbi:MAG: FG-GAP repeat-containing protein [Parcubacteria group bacterium Athens1014_10]|nr:MAG: FG-GAP repeat-containing protein [Parcubacteria group bacterium Athens1014_10]TSD05969.1 MAG: FG-GAP repeat-containing protein [Parcubacteria group bacterium Athens0714_12]